ncbi:MAG: cytochrome c-type biogenesis protein CcmH [Candidatus Azotimanducaceae bacterium]|jgi:cytochrome c-type biogenesis protein CcmH
MTFWIFTVVMSLAAVAFFLVPGYLMRRREDLGDRTRANLAIYEERAGEYDVMLNDGDISQAQHDTFIVELKRNLLSDATETDATETVGEGERQAGRLPVVFALLVPLFAFVAYSDQGLSWGAINDVALAQSLSSESPHDQDAMGENVEKLAERLKSQPENHEGWYMLGRSFLNMGRYEEASEAFAHLLKTFTEDHSLFAFYAEALYMADDRTVTPRVAAAIEKTLDLNPHDITMLEIKALGAYQRGELRPAIGMFQKALAAGAEGERADLINRAIVRIQEDLGDAPMMAEAEADVASTPGATSEATSEAMPEAVKKPIVVASQSATTGRTLKILVEVADSVAMPANTSVFVFARAVSGPPMPLAVKRMTRADLPALITLDESMAMMQGMGLANFDTVQVVARISSSGIANAGPEDYQALSGSIDLTEEIDVVKLNISKQVKDF